MGLFYIQAQVVGPEVPPFSFSEDKTFSKYALEGTHKEMLFILDVM